MRRLFAVAAALLVTLLLSPGCASDSDKAQWAEFWKDVRGENMEMGSHSTPAPLKAPDQ
jgi:hypothetical protein